MPLFFIRRFYESYNLRVSKVLYVSIIAGIMLAGLSLSLLVAAFCEEYPIYHNDSAQARLYEHRKKFMTPRWNWIARKRLSNTDYALRYLRIL